MRPESVGFDEAARELQSLLTSVALGHIPDREAAMSYTRLREQLLTARAEAGLPGFVKQCVSIASFRTFIGLYHSDKLARENFVESSFAHINRGLGRSHAGPIRRKS